MSFLWRISLVLMLVSCSGRNIETLPSVAQDGRTKGILALYGFEASEERILMGLDLSAPVESVYNLSLEVSLKNNHLIFSNFVLGEFSCVNEGSGEICLLNLYQAGEVLPDIRSFFENSYDLQIEKKPLSLYGASGVHPATPLLTDCDPAGKTEIQGQSVVITFLPKDAALATKSLEVYSFGDSLSSYVDPFEETSDGAYITADFSSFFPDELYQFSRAARGNFYQVSARSYVELPDEKYRYFVGCFTP